MIFRTYIPTFLLFILSFFMVQNCHAQLGQLIWNDEFNQGQLDLTKWSYEEGTGVNGDWGTGQLDLATKRIENVHFEENVDGAEDDCLAITTRKEFYIDRNYTSGRIRTAGKASWGAGHRIVARIKPTDVRYKGQGFAFWMLADEIPAGYDFIMWPQGGEIDIMEYVGSIPFNNLGTVHYAWFWENNTWQSWNHGLQGAYYNYETKEVPNPSEPGYGNYPPDWGDPLAGSSKFHQYGIDWHTDRIEFFVDNHVYHIHYLEDGGAFALDGQDKFEITDQEGRRVAVSEYSHHFEEWYPFEHKLYAILSGGVGGSQNTYGGAIVPEAEFPCTVYIDWVRVYELGPLSSIESNDLTSKHVKIFPNPAQDFITIESITPGKYELIIQNMESKIFLNQELHSNTKINIEELPVGVYFVSLRNEKQTFSKKFTKL